MGRTGPSIGRPPPGFRRDARAKKAKATINKTIPSLLSTHPRARRGIEASELIVDPPPLAPTTRPPQAAAKGLQEGEGRGPRITLTTSDTLEAAHALLLLLLLLPQRTSSSSSPPPAEPSLTTVDRANTTTSSSRVGVLNMASPLSPGGGFVNGATSQEESLCMRTTLLPGLRDEFYRLPEVGAVYTPDVLVFRGGTGSGTGYGEGEEGKERDLLPKSERWFVDVVSAAMLRLPETEEVAAAGVGGSGSDGGRHHRYVQEKDRELAARKMRGVMRTFQSKGVKKVVLGAWGCGAYGNPVAEVAGAWRRVLCGGGGGGGGGGKGKRGKKKKKEAETWDGIEEVVFAIKDPGLADAFETAFGEGLVRADAGGRRGRGAASDDDPEAMRLRELRAKIQEMEVRIGQAQSPQLRSGLSSVLVGLRSQLPLDDDDGGEALERHDSASGSGREEADEDVGDREVGDSETEDETDDYGSFSDNEDRG